MPYEVIDGRPQFLWHLAGELPAAGLVAYLAPMAAGAVIVLTGFVARSTLTVALTVVAALAGTAVLTRLGADATAWDVLALPGSLADRPSPALLALALTAAGSSATSRPRARRVGQIMLVAAVGLVAWFYLWPGRGEAPMATVVRMLSRLDDLPHWQLQLGFIVIAVLALWPGIMALLGLVHVWRPAQDEHPTIGLVAIYGLPLCLAMLVFRALTSSPDGWIIFGPVGGILVLTGIIALLASGLEVLTEQLVVGPGSQASRLGRLGAAAGVLGVLSLGQWLLARPPHKGVDWTLTAITAEADEVFDTLLPRWNKARRHWDGQVRRTSGARALVEVKAAARRLLTAAAPVDSGLESALGRLTREANDLHVAGRHWYALVHDVNEASRRAGLPYYLDPTVLIFQTPEGLRRHFRMRSYRVEAVRRFEVEGRAFATLHVRRLGSARDGRRLLGFSRDLQPFALVDLDEIGEFVQGLESAAGRPQPTCAPEEAGTPSEAMQRCGAVLSQLTARLPQGLGPGLNALTERHELQHQIDGPHLAMSGAVLARWSLGESAQWRVNRELSAYLAELTASDASPLLGLLHLFRFALPPRPSAEHHVAIITLGVLSGMSVSDDEGQAVPDRVLAAFDHVAALDDTELRARAAAAWADLFGQALATPTALDPPPWMR